MITCFVGALSGASVEGFCLSVLFLVWMMRIAISVGTRWLETEPDTVLYFAPWVREIAIEDNVGGLTQLGVYHVMWSMSCSSG